MVYAICSVKTSWHNQTGASTSCAALHTKNKTHGGRRHSHVRKHKDGNPAESGWLGSIRKKAGFTEKNSKPGLFVFPRYLANCRSPPVSDVLIFQKSETEERAMKKYKNSDYALNKFSQGIVYKFADRIVEITLLDYLAENPSKTEQDFLKLKDLSDEIYHQQDVTENRTSRLNVSINGLEETEQLATVSLDTELIHKSDAKKAMKAAKKLLESGLLTEVQRRRFLLHFYQGLSIRQIAKRESVRQRAVWDSLQWSAKKLKKFFDE